MLPLLVASALAGNAILHVGVHREAGTLADIAADGASGQCVMQHSRVICPATGPVTFRWGPGGDWTLRGQTVVEPGQTGIAHVLAVEGTAGDVSAQLAGADDFNLVETLVVEAFDNPLPPEDVLYMRALEGLRDNPDWRIRVRQVWGLTRFWRRSSNDPYGVEAPRLLSEGLIADIASDRDFHVRRALAASLLEVPQESPYWEEAHQAVVMLLGDPAPQVRRAAVKSAAINAKSDAPAMEAWTRAMQQVQEPGPPGRSACVALALLNRHLSAADVDPRAAVARVLQHHPEKAWRVWAAWREDVPYEAAWAEVLLRDTVGVSGKLVRAWARDAPEELAQSLVRWEPIGPHSRRYLLIRQALSEVTDPAVRGVLDP